MSLPSLERVDAREAFPTQALEAFPTQAFSSLRTPASQGVGSVRETVSSQASTSPWSFFQPVMDFFASIFQTIGDFFKPIFDFFSKKIQTGAGDIREVVSDTGDIREGVYGAVEVDYGGVCQGLKVNVPQISNRPNPLDLPLIQPNAESAISSISIEEFFTQFDRICDEGNVPHNQTFFENQFYTSPCMDRYVKPWMNRYQARSLLSRYKEIVHLKDDNECPYSSTIGSEMDKALKRIIFELRNPADGTEEDASMIRKKLAAIGNLCRAVSSWRSRLLKEAFKTARFLSGQRETLDEIVQHYVQDAKEELFIEHYSDAHHTDKLITRDNRVVLGDSQETLLNYIRRSVGQQLGLDVNRNNFQDPCIECGPDYTFLERDYYDYFNDAEAVDFLRAFKRIYTPQSILSKMKRFLNERIASDTDFAQVIRNFIPDQIQVYEDTGELVSANTADMPMPYQSDTAYHLTDAGVKFIMVRFGILNPVTSPGNLARAEQ